MTYALILIGIVVAFTLVRFIRRYRLGNAMEQCIKDAVLAMLVRLTSDFAHYGDDSRYLMAAAVSFCLTSAHVEGRRDAVEDYFNRNRKPVEEEAARVLASDSELREIVIQTQRYLVMCRKAHNRDEAANELLNNRFTQPYRNEYPLIDYGDYFRLVRAFALKEFSKAERT